MTLYKDEAKFLGSLMRLKNEIDQLETKKFNIEWEIMIVKKSYNDRVREYVAKEFEKEKEKEKE